MGFVCTGYEETSPMDPQSVSFVPTVRRVNAGQRAYLSVFLNAPGVTFYGIRVTYTTNP